MAVGIISYGSYVPYRRLQRAAIAQLLGIPADDRAAPGDRVLREPQKIDRVKAIVSLAGFARGDDCRSRPRRDFIIIHFRSPSRAPCRRSNRDRAVDAPHPRRRSGKNGQVGRNRDAMHRWI